jgi:hypothetical protein
MRITAFLLASVAVIGLSACSGVKTEAKYPTGYDRVMTGNDIYGKKESVFGADGLQLFGDKSKDTDNQTGIGVNGYLWRASLDTVSFMPLASADPFGGVILTDWYAPNDGDERFKLNVFILGRELKSDGVQVKVFRQVKSKGGSWTDSEAPSDMASRLEDTILTRAREMRVAKLNSN